jgi:hypothetical protein
MKVSVLQHNFSLPPATSSKPPLATQNQNKSHQEIPASTTNRFNSGNHNL